ncbi:NAD(P)-binding protein [Mollisia scopiformis]|uniref:NAD(P)-binding protein n=1 Tax=Mollisia scopiformis TaxID=149040 RepID=A0A194XGQ6_MOLSC|nr:NAD(P)-binding protein [Mollisia scopiformis]KUJ19321.1 NAD(P)-binding protein [Mollisia scopiformis]
MSTTPTVVLITGANRGIGKGLVESYLARPDHAIIAAVRDPSTAGPLKEIPVAEGSRLIVVKIDATIQSDAVDVVKELSTKHAINHLDTVIANAGVCYIYPTVAEVKIDDMLASLKPNVFGVIYLYQATRELLNNGANPKWVTIGSVAGSIEGQLPNPNAAYGPTKAAVHWITKRINTEEKKITSFVLHPGWVATDMGNVGAHRLGMKEAPVSIKDSVDGMVKIIDKASKDTHGGIFWEYTGEQYPW